MEVDTKLKILKMDLQIMTPKLDEYLTFLLSTAADFIAREGIALGSESDADAMLEIMYAAWLYRKRKTGEPMPRALRYNLNNRLFSQKMRGGAESG